MSGTLLVINGTSSSGKTSLVKSIQRLADRSFLDAGLDRFIWMLPGRYLEQPLWDDVLGKADTAGLTGHQLVMAMHRAAVTLCEAGWDVCMDHVLVEQAWALDLAQVCRNTRAYLIGVECPLDVLEKREKERRDRTLGQAVRQFPLVHRWCMYDISVNSASFSPDECARSVLSYVLSHEPNAIHEMKFE
jgi:chloramphenicol 3-O phosphotransferase